MGAPQPDFFGAGGVEPAGLDAWVPSQWAVAPDWQPLLAGFLAAEAGRRLEAFITRRLAAGATIYPPQPLRALALTPLAAVRVVILGQDPYHGPGQAEGLAFSVAPGGKTPPSLRNIHKELVRDPLIERTSPPAQGSLVPWAQQGVLLLNTCLTVEDGQPASHAGQGWEVLTDHVIRAVLAAKQPVVFMLWGAHAQRAGLAAGLDHADRRCLVLQANHPSPLSALRPPQPFLGCGHFSLANAFLQRHGHTPVRW